MIERQSRPDGLRERTRRAVRSQIAEQAMELFIDQGFDKTSLEQIADAVGISARSVSRHFSSKEDLVVGQLYYLGHEVAAALEARPGSEPPWTALRAALEVAVEAILSDRNGLPGAAVVFDTPALRAAMADRHLYWVELLVPYVLTRQGDRSDSAQAEVEAEALASAALACLHVAISAWVRGNASKPLSSLLDTAFAAVHTCAPSAQ